MSEWISVEDELPERFGQYLGWDGMSVDIEWFVDGEWLVGGVTHWMPLPEPPEDSDE